MLKNSYRFEVVVNGKPVQEYFHEGLNFVEGKERTEFSLRLQNNTFKQALFVPTIDGLSVMDGKEASFDSSGYLVAAGDSIRIDGWRLSDSEVAKFFFAKIKDSYAAKTGKGGNAGVIGCAVFAEKEKVKPIVIKEYIHTHHRCHGLCQQCNPHVYWNSGGNTFTLSGQLNGVNTTSMSFSGNAEMTKASNTSNEMQIRASSLGTGFGEAKYAPVSTVEFERCLKPETVFAIHYNTRENLKAMGVQFKTPVYASASPFPKEAGYCLPPKDWEGR